jgi:mRNA-degrading endonuclease toxin of MazEF toxin-antitoxin module
VGTLAKLIETGAIQPHAQAVAEPSAANDLRLRSHIMTDKISALRRERVRQVPGSLDDEESAQLDSALAGARSGDH